MCGRADALLRGPPDRVGDAGEQRDRLEDAEQDLGLGADDSERSPVGVHAAEQVTRTAGGEDECGKRVVDHGASLMAVHRHRAVGPVVVRGPAEWAVAARETGLVTEDKGRWWRWKPPSNSAHLLLQLNDAYARKAGE